MQLNIPPSRMFRYANVLTVVLLFAISFWGCKKQDDANSKPNDTHIAARFAKKHLTEPEFNSLDWDKLREVKNGGTLGGWIVYPKTTDSNALSSYFIEVKNGKPAEIVSYKIDSRKRVLSGEGVIQYDRKAYISGSTKSEFIELGTEKKVSANDIKGKEVRKLVSECECCGTLPCVIVYAKRRVKVIYVDMGAFDGSESRNRIYVPMWDLGGGGSPTGGDEYAGEEFPIIHLSDLIDWSIIGINLYLRDNYPGKDLGFPWKWWEEFTTEELGAIEKVKEEFEEELPSTSPCKGTQKFPGRTSYSGTAEHLIIQFDYMAKHLLTAEREYSIPHSSINGNTGFADLVNNMTREIFEIKPENNDLEIAKGITEVERYVEKACIFCGGGFIKGQNYPETIMPYPGRPDRNMRVRLNQNGLITYQEVPKSQVPVPVPVPESVSQNLKDFFKKLLADGEMAEEMIAYWLKKNPEVKNYLIAAGVGLIIGTIIEDFATLGIGISDDIPSILLAMKLIRLARTIP